MIEGMATAHATVPVPATDVDTDDEAAPSVGSPTRPVVLDTVARDESEIAGARPTAVPTYDVEALAAASSWEAQLGPSRQPTPLDLCVPVRIRAAAPADGASLRAAFLLSHVDDRLSVAEIASSAQIPIADAVAIFSALAERGVIELRGSTAANRALGPSAGHEQTTESSVRPSSRGSAPRAPHALSHPFAVSERSKPTSSR
jgi:hypothetical protein